jgi:hypothetical protein
MPCVAQLQEQRDNLTRLATSACLENQLEGTEQIECVGHLYVYMYE